ncbi:hypothetical protein ES705_36340 [subsurface metagenome]
MKLRYFLCVNAAWARKNLILTFKDIQDLAIVHGLNTLKIEKRSGSHGLGFYYGSTCIAEARIVGGELRTDVADSSPGHPVLVLENGATLSPEELDGYTIVQAKGSEMIWARGGAR